MKLFWLIIFGVVTGMAHGQSFAELQLKSATDLSKAIEAAKADKDRTKVFFGLLKLGSFYLDENKIPLCDSVLQIIEKDYSDIISKNVSWRTLSTADYYQLLSSYYYVKNDNVKSKFFLEKARHLGSDVFSYTNNLYRLFIKEGKLDSAELYLKESFPRLAKDLDVHKLDINLLNKFELSFRNMCHLKVMQGDVAGLKFYLSKWLPISGRNLDNPAGIKTGRLRSLAPWKLIFLSKFFVLTGHLEEAKRVLELTTKETERELRLESLRSWAQFYYTQSNVDSTVAYLKKVLSLHKENIKTFFPFFTEIERENYVNELNDDYDLLLSVITENPLRNDEYLTEIFEFQLFRKGLLLDITKTIGRTASTLKSEAALKLLKEIKNVNDTIAYITFRKTISFGDGKEQALRVFNARKEACEKKFLQLMQTESAKLFTVVTAPEITTKLTEESCLLEMIRFRKWVKDKRRIISSEGISYAILKIENTGKIDVILLSDGEELEGPYAALYKNTIQGRMTDTRLYEIYWSKIFDMVKGLKQVFLSPDGIYNIINVNTLQQPDSKRFVLDEMSLINLTSPKDLLGVPKSMGTGNEALLLGYPQYSFAQTSESKPATFRGSILESLERIREEQFALLPATQDEIESISEIIRSNGGKTTILEGKEATELNLKSALIPEILHLATHGFFIGSENSLINPLLKSGLVLAGVNNKDSFEDSSEDGILTAFEIASLDLKKTKLVILSACETGLGDVKNGDGVYGLQRAFKMAEARFIILSMWKVDDEATMQLMKLFYKSLVQTNDVALSFDLAQKELRVKYPDPYYWGAFKLFGY